MSTPISSTHSGHPAELKVISHTSLFYWWPVWLAGFILAGLTYAEGTRLAILPAGIKVREASTKGDYELTGAEHSAALAKAAANTAQGKEPFPVRIAERKKYGMVYLVVLLAVIFGSSVPLRGTASVVAILAIVVVTMLLAWAEWWGTIFDYLGGLHVEISLAGYLFPSVVLCILWLGTVFLYDPLRYMVFTPGQFVLHKEIGDLRQVYDPTEVTVEKRRTDLFRHWVLGCGAGDVVIKVPSQSLQIELPNVLFVDQRVARIANLLKMKPVLTQ